MMDQLVCLVTFLGLFIAWLQLEQQGSLLLTDPKTMSIALYSLVLSWFMLLIKLTFPMFYQAYVSLLPFGVELFGSVSMASTASLLFPESARPLMHFIFLVVPVGKIFWWISGQMEQHFGDTEFWRFLLLLKFDLRRMMNREVIPLLPVSTT